MCSSTVAVAQLTFVNVKPRLPACTVEVVVIEEDEMIKPFLSIGKDQTTIDLWTRLNGRQRVLQFHLGNVPMMNLEWNELDEKQKGIVLNAGQIFGLDHARLPEPLSFS